VVSVFVKGFKEERRSDVEKDECACPLLV